MRLRSLVALAMLLLLSVGPVFAQSTLTVGVGDIQGVHGEDVEIPVEVSGASQVGAMHIEVVYDPAVLLPIRSVATGDLNSTALIQYDDRFPGKLVISMIHAQGFSGDGVVAKVVARVAGKDGASTPLDLQNVTANHVQTKAALVATVSNGSFTEGGAMAASAGVWVLLGLLAVVIVGAGAYAFTRRTTGRRAPAAAPTARLGLQVVQGVASPAFLPLDQPITTMGRSSSNRLVLDDEMVSREHARIVSGGDVHTIYDLGSANGTFVNGQQVTTQRILQAGDQITMGSATLLLRQA
jgi:hypothetical protein